MEKVQVIVLAAGHGKRMNNQQIPKVLSLVKGKPIITCLLDAIKQSRICKKIVIVVGQQAQVIKKTLGNDYIYVRQSQQLGTGHAVLSCKSLLENYYENIMVLYGDQPFLTAKTISRLAEIHLNTKAILTLATVTVPDFHSWRKALADFGRIVRNNQGNLTKIIETKDATPLELQIKEVNPSFFVFKAEWLWKNLINLKNNNTQKEYYLTDLLKTAVDQKVKISTYAISAREAYGINTYLHLKQAQQI